MPVIVAGAVCPCGRGIARATIKKNGMMSYLRVKFPVQGFLEALHDR
jgi:hypothetical protein